MKPADVRAISVREPWATAIADGHKLTENRSAHFPKAYRGLLMVHASKQWSSRGQWDSRIREIYADGERALLPMDFAFGEIVAVVDVVDIHTGVGCCGPWGETTYRDADGVTRIDVTHLVFDRDVSKLPEPVKCSGRLGLWRPPGDVVRKVMAQVRDPEGRMET